MLSALNYERKPCNPLNEIELNIAESGTIIYNEFWQLLIFREIINSIQEVKELKEEANSHCTPEV